MVILGIDVGGYSIKAGVVDDKGKIIENYVAMTEPERGRDVVVENIVNTAKHFLGNYKDIKSIGVGIPGIIDKEGYVQNTPNIPLSKFDLGAVLKDKLKKNMAFGNDANNFALAQLKYGHGKGMENILCLTLGTGVGSGIILNGKLFSKDGAPELGHTTINFEAKESRCCDNNGCIESYIGRKSFPEGPLEIYKKALANDIVAVKRFQYYGKYLGIALSNFINIFNPDIVVLGGELSNAYSLFKKNMEEEVGNRALFKTKIVKNTLKQAGLVGAASLVQ